MRSCLVSAQHDICTLSDQRHALQEFPRIVDQHIYADRTSSVCCSTVLPQPSRARVWPLRRIFSCSVRSMRFFRAASAGSGGLQLGLYLPQASGNSTGLFTEPVVLQVDNAIMIIRSLCCIRMLLVTSDTQAVQALDPNHHVRFQGPK